MALPSLRSVFAAQGGQQGEGAVAVSEMAVFQKRLDADGFEQVGVLEEDLLGVVFVANRPLYRGGARRRVPRRHMASQEGRRAHRDSRRTSCRLASGAVGKQRSVGRAHGPHARARDVRLRRLCGLCQGSLRRMADNQDPAMPLPCVRPGEALHHPQTEARSGLGAPGDRKRALEGRGRRRRDILARRIQRLVRPLEILPLRVHLQRWQESLDARKAS